MKHEKLRNFLWGIGFGVCLTSLDSPSFEFPLGIMILIGGAFLINFNEK